MAKKYNITIPQPYKDKNGQDKTSWNTVGKLIEYEDRQSGETKRFIELFMFPNTNFKVFEEKPKNAPQSGQDHSNTPTTTKEYSDAPKGNFTPNNDIPEDNSPVDTENLDSLSDIPF